MILGSGNARPRLARSSITPGYYDFENAQAQMALLATPAQFNSRKVRKTEISL